jgi:hypothetical protein
VKRPTEIIAAELDDVNRHLIDMLPDPSAAPFSFPMLEHRAGNDALVRPLPEVPHRQ